MAPLDGSLDIILAAGIDAIRGKSIAMTQFLIEGIDSELKKSSLAIATPREPSRRGGHLAIRHPAAQSITENLAEEGVMVDYRPPRPHPPVPQPPL